MKGTPLLPSIPFLSLICAEVRAQPCPAIDQNYAASPLGPGFATILGGPSTVVVFTAPNDDGMSAPDTIGFPFDAFGLPKTTFQVSANGFVALDGNLPAGFSTNTLLPSISPPSDFFAPWWADLFHLAPSATTVRALVGAPGTRQLIVEWIDLERYPNNGSGENARFQLVLNEAGGTVEFRYDGSSFSTGTDPWLATVGGESALSALGFDATGAGVSNPVFPAVDLLLAPVPATPTVAFAYTAIPTALPFPAVVGTPGAVPLFSAPQDEGISAAAPIGFPFSFFGVPKTSFQVSANGFVAFDSSLAVGFPANAPPGTAGFPNDLAAPWWDDLAHFAPTAATAYLVTGPPGSRALTVEWRNLERAPGNGSGENVRFAAVFREGTDAVEFHHDFGSFATGANAWNATVGLESGNGALALDVTGGGASNPAIPFADFELDPCDCGFQSPFGTGCPTSPGIFPSIGSTGGAPLPPNPTYAITLSSAPAGSPALLLLGASNTSWSGAPLPVPLSAFGGPAACSLLVSPDVFIPVTASPTGTVTVGAPLPAGLLCGGTAYAQWAVFDPVNPVFPSGMSGGLAVSL
ncbi:MAG: hypothetical protein L0323_17660 [Planctomycetes bacterium]|nr:hypothetical protein [Planctomycetota bacterium]